MDSLQTPQTPRSFYWILFLGCASFLVIAHVFETSRLFFYRDFWQFYYPSFSWALSVFRAGDLPLWNPYIASGFPAFAGMLYSYAYPGIVLLFPFGLESGLKIYIFFHIFWAGLGTFLLCRYWKCSAPASTVSALIFMLSGSFLSGVNNLAYLVTPSWMPWALWAYAHTFKNRYWCIPTAFIMAMMALSGEAQTCYNMGLIFIFFAMSQLDFSERRRSLKNATLHLFMIIGIALGLSAVQIFPAFELASHSERLKGVSGTDALFFSIYFEDFARFFVPYIYGNPTDIWYGRISNHSAPFMSSLYFGLLSFPLILAGLFSSQNRRILFFLIGSVLFFLLTSLGAELPFYKILRNIHFPLWSSFRYAEKLILPATFLLALFAAFGFDTLFLWPKAKQKKFCQISGIGLFLAVFTVIIFVPPFAEGSTQLQESANHYRQFQIGASLLIAGIVALFFFFFAKLSQYATPTALCCCVLLATDLIYHQRQILPTVDLSFYQKNCPTPLAPLANQDQYRYAFIAPIVPAYRAMPTFPFVEQYRKWGLGNLPGVFHVSQDWGILQTVPDPYAKIREIAGKLALQQKPGYENLFARFAVSRLICHIPDPHHPDPQEICLREVSNPRPRYSLAYQSITAKTQQEALQYMVQVSATVPVLLEEDQVPKLPATNSPSNNQGKITRLPSSTNELLFSVEVDRPAYLILADVFYPGWKAFLEEKETPIFRADLTFRLVYVPEGKHQLRFSYQPRSFYLGGFFSVLTFILLSFFGLNLLWKHHQKKNKSFNSK